MIESGFIPILFPFHFQNEFHFKTHSLSHSPVIFNRTTNSIYCNTSHKLSKSSNFRSKFSNNDEISSNHELIQFLLGKSASSRGARAVLSHFYSTLKQEHNHVHEFTFQSCPTNIRMRYGMTFYAVNSGWNALREFIAWNEIPQRRTLPNKEIIRTVKTRNITFSRELIIKMHQFMGVLESMPQWNALRPDETNLHEDSKRIQSSVSLLTRNKSELVAKVKLPKLPVPNGTTVAVHCVRPEYHSSGDRNPSLVLWMNKDGRTGGGKCMVCKRNSATNHSMTFRVEYRDQNAYLYEARMNLKAGKSGIADKDKDLAVESSDSSENEGIVGNKQRKKRVKPGRRDVKDAIERNHGPVGGLVDEELIVDENWKYIGAVLKEKFEHRSQDKVLLRTNGTIQHGNPLELMQKSEKKSVSKSKFKRIEQMEWFLESAAQFHDSKVNESSVQTELLAKKSKFKLPMPVLSVSRMTAARFRQLSNGRFVPVGWKSMRQEWILLDVDNIQFPKSNERDIEALASRLIAVVRRDTELSGRCMILRTGLRGLHVWAELREPRIHPVQWFASKETREWYVKLGQRLLIAARKSGAYGGKVDMSSYAAGRYGRRPGWRILENGKVFRSHIISVAAVKVSSRTPRKGLNNETESMNSSLVSIQAMNVLDIPNITAFFKRN